MKKGFTLIELLAVIVILAIIALISTPIILNIINDAKESSILRSADSYLKGVEYAITKSVLDGKSINDGTYSIVEENICLDEECIEALEIEVDGEKPNSGTLTIIGGKINDVNLVYLNVIVKQNKEGKLVLGELKETLAKYIKLLYNETSTKTVNNIEYSLDETHLLMNDRLGSSEVSKLDGNIRYYGANPNNYIDIGDRDENGNIIFWRIIGLFKDIEITNKAGNVIGKEDLVKIMRADFLTSIDRSSFSWDYTSTGVYNNNWHDSTLQIMLNDEANGYYASGTPTYYKTSLKLNFEGSGLSSEVHGKIERVNWDLGLYRTSDVYVETMYGLERIGTNKWSGKVALMYGSDYGYASNLKECQTTLINYNLSACKDTNWLYKPTKSQWTLTPSSLNSNFSLNIYDSGSLDNRYVYVEIGVRPVLYLKSDVRIVEEKETSEGIKYLVVE